MPAIRSLWFTWLRKEDKSLSLPDIVFADEPNRSGCYYHPDRNPVFIGANEYCPRRGLIVVGIESNDDEQIANTIAHEWRHHWQFHNMKHTPYASFDSSIPYQAAIRNFFRSDHKEMDALIFSHKIAPCETTEIWLEYLRKG